jgi:hypothetical protein
MAVVSDVSRVKALERTRESSLPRALSNVLGPVPEVDVMAKRPQGLLNVGTLFRADGGAAFLRS